MFSVRAQPVELPAEVPEAESDSDSGVGSPMDEGVTDAAATAAVVQAEEGKLRLVKEVNVWEAGVNTLDPFTFKTC